MGTALMLGVCASLAACSPVLRVTTKDPRGSGIKVTQYAPYFDTRTMLVQDKVGLDLVVDLEKKVIPVVYGVQQAWGALGPKDMDATGLFTAYVHNLTLEPLTLTISSMTHAGQPIPAIPVTIELKPDTYQKVELGRVQIGSYATELAINMTYALAGEAPISRDLSARRQTPQKIKSDVARWKGKKKNVPAFFTNY